MLFVMLAALISAAWPLSDAYAQGDLITVTIQGDGAAMSDTYMSSSAPTTNNGSATVFAVGENNSATSVGRGLLQFDLSGLPNDLTVVSATVSLWVSADHSDNARVMSAYAIQAGRNWVETQATWNNYKTSVAWGTAGGGNTTNDIVGTAIGTVSVANNLTAGTQVDIILDPGAVQSMRWQDYFGFELQMATENNDRYDFVSSDNATAGQRPKIVIEYYADTPTPDPGWKCYEGQNGGEILYVWPDCAPGGAAIPPVMSPYIAAGGSTTVASVGGFIVNESAATLQCTPYPQCVNNFPIYYRLTYDANWTKGGGGLTSTFHTDLIVLGAAAIPLTVGCGTGLSGECFGTFQGTVPTSSLPSNQDGGYTVGVQSYFTWDGIVGGMTHREINWTIYFSLVPFDQNCADTWFVPVPDTYVIDPTIETPVGQPTDYQKYTTVPAAEYMIRVQHGPWNDGAADRTDAAFSLDGSTWHNLALLQFFVTVVCIDTDPFDSNYDVQYFTAPGTDFYIRANDTPTNFSDNTNDGVTPFEYVIGVAFENTAAASCESQFTYDEVNDLLVDVSVPGNDDDVQATDSVSSPLEAGAWYAIQVTSGLWNESGGPPRVDMEFEFEGGLGNTDWVDLADGSNLVWCQTEDGLITFVQAPGNADLELHLRVNDQDGPQNWSDNSGTLDVSIFHASFNRTPTGCELQFEAGAFLKHDSVEGNQSAGKSFGTYPTQLNLVYWVDGSPLISIPTGDKTFVPGGWYMLETVEGPWWTTFSGGDVVANTHYYNMEIKVGAEDWQPLEEWSDAECIAPTDELGHVRVYFQVPNDTTMGDDQYMLRVASNSFMFTRGHMAWDLYAAMDWGYTGATGNCDDYNYDPDTTHHEGAIDANVEDGEYVNGLAVGQVFAIKIESANTSSDAPFFQDSGWFESVSSSTELDGLQLSLNGTDFETLPGASGVLCSYTEPVSGELVFFVRPQNGEAFKMRADSTTFANNVGREYYTVYQASAGNLNTWESCIDSYEMHIPPLNPHAWIDVKDPQGELIASLAQYAEYNGLLAPDAELPPEIYKDPNSLGNYIIEIEYGTGPWLDGETDTQHFNAELSKDGGATWEVLDGDSTLVTCSSSDPLRKYWKAFIQVESGDVWRIRVADSDTDTFSDNTGNLAYILYSAGGFEVPPSDNSNIGYVNVQGGGDVCEMAPVMPDPFSLTSIDALGTYFGDWIAYANLSVERYMAFCPRHTEMFFSVFDLLKKKEPFATLTELDTMQADIVRELKAYGWDPQGGTDLSFIWGTKTPSQIQRLVDQYVFDQGVGDPWADGAQLLPNGLNPTAMPSSYDTCRALFPDYKRFAEGLCFASSMMKETSASFWIQFGFDIGAMLWVFSIIWASILDVISMFTGVPLNRGSGLQRTVVNIVNGRDK